MTHAIVVGLIAAQRPKQAAMVGAAVLVAKTAPLILGIGALAAVARSAMARIRASSADRAATRRDVAALAEMTVVGLTGGLSVRSALSLAAESVGGSVGRDARSLLRRMHISGSAACATHHGPGVDLYRVIGRAEASGSSLLEPVSRLADQLAADLASERLEQVRRLPVAMLFPLTLLILPGFLLLTVAPALLVAFARLDF